MSLIVSCPKCAKKFKVGDDKAGKKIKCSACGTIVSIPAPAAPKSSEDGDIDLWDLPPSEDPNAPPAELPPVIRPGSSGSKKPRPNSKSKKSSEGMSPALKTTLIVLGVLGGITAIGCGGCLIMVRMGAQKAAVVLTEIGDKLEEEKKAQEARDAEKAKQARSQKPGTDSSSDASPSKPSDTATSQGQVDAATATPAAVLSTEDVLNDKYAAWQNLQGKVIEAKAPLQNIHYNDTRKSMVIVLENGPTSGSRHCTLSSNIAPDWWKTALSGKVVVIRGVVSGGIYPELINCVVMSSEQPPGPTVTAEELAGYMADPVKLRQKFPLASSTKYLVTGKIASFQKKGESYVVVMEPTGKFQINITLEAYNMPPKVRQNIAFKVGDTINAYGGPLFLGDQFNLDQGVYLPTNGP